MRSVRTYLAVGQDPDVTIHQKKVRVKLEPVLLPPDGLARRLALLADRSVEPILDEFGKDIRDHEFSRQSFSHRFSGNVQKAFVNLTRTVAPVDVSTKFVFLNNNLNPHLPCHPGQAGLFYRSRDDDLRGVSCELITKLSANHWRYRGTYKLIPLEHLSTVEWAAQSGKVRVSSCNPS